jgi:hypothetical protein
MAVTKTITYKGGPARVSALVQMLEEQGVNVEWEPPTERRDLTGAAEAIVLSLVASGAYDAIKAAVAKFRKWAPRAEVTLEGDEEDAAAAQDDEISRTLDELANDETATAARIAVCEAIGAALSRLGQVFWLTGNIVGHDRKSGESPFGFGDDGAVGVATIIQMGGALAQGAVQLLKSGNLYAAAALVRQIVEIEYLASAFAADHGKAAAWLRAGRAERLKFWSPAQLRKGSAKFLASDYWNHCDLGGHPTVSGMGLLPGHRTHSELVWVDLAGHLSSIWKQVEYLAENLLDGPIPTHWKLPDVTSVRDDWLRADGFYAAILHFDDIRRGGSDSES